MIQLKHMWRWLLVFLALALGLVLTACAASTSRGKTTIKIGYMPNTNSASLAAIAQKAGYFEAAGFNVKLIQFASGPAEIAAMQAGSIDFAQIGSGAHGTLAQGKAVAIMLDCISKDVEVIGNTGSGITSLKDLKGKKVAVTKGTTGEQLLVAALKKVGMTEADVTILSMNASAITSAMASGKVDACAAWSPSTTEITKKLGKQAVVLASSTTYLKSLPMISSWVTSPTYLKKHAARVQKFVKALAKAANYRAQGKNAAKWVAQVLGISEQTVATQLKTTAKFYSGTEIMALAKSGALVKMYARQQANAIKMGMLVDTGSLLEAQDYVETAVMISATK